MNQGLQYTHSFKTTEINIKRTKGPKGLKVDATGELDEAREVEQRMVVFSFKPVSAFYFSADTDVIF